MHRLTRPWIKERRLFAVMGALNADLGAPTLKRILDWDDVRANLMEPVYAESGSTALFTGDRWSHWFEGHGLMIDHILLVSSLRKKVHRWAKWCMGKRQRCDVLGAHHPQGARRRVMPPTAGRS